ncbi:MAE_28990/MAE_18760 family HEPN-like nuclease [uncultured Brevundimonas sp.]|uniref:MAE_28990/MAE_18760 family HEPN-like nuclease n=1 Tax=uncultured Brevundimonas sp. TaxID=213418 RepID=UPI0030EE269D
MALTVAQLSTQIEADLDWRHAELAVFRELLILDAGNSIRRNVLFRGAWAILYAHYEGFCKYSLQLLAEFLQGLPDCAALPHSTFLFVHDKKMRQAKGLPTSEAYEFFRVTVEALRAGPPPVGSVDTKSNLWPNLLDKILIDLDLQSYGVVQSPVMVKTLVSRRNDIAHGQKVFIKDLTYYKEYEQVVSEIMYSLALAIVDRASRY